ncbi:MAG: methyltransferase domain-containing protein [Flavobacteriales bacterium]|nr:methyltransferase domain-containing protein [Flavobacteriales bacterium]
METLDKNFWSKRWQDKSTGWDVGTVSAPFVPFFDSLENKETRILIPGCGNAYEAEELWKRGFKNVTIVDIAPEPLALFKARVPGFPEAQLICTDFFAFTGQFDLIIEQTFFCALPPALRPDYARHMHALLAPGGRIAGLMFNFPLTEEGPPFGGSEEEYRGHFDPYFSIRTMVPCTNSIAPRAGRELWVEMEKLA